MAALCRLCLSARGDTRPIFPAAAAKEPLPLAARIRACVSVQVDEDDGYPTQICKKCLNNVNNWHVFKKVCEDSQIKLRDWMRDDITEQQLEVKIKNEPTSEDDDNIIDASYPGIEMIEDVGRERLQPEGPPILASLGLAPRNEKDSDEEYSMAAMMVSSTLSTEGEHRPVPVEQLASKNCLVCGRAYRYSHNARRHERNAHSYDRYTNKIESNIAIPSARHTMYKSITNNYYDGKEGIMKYNSKPPHMMNHSYSMKSRLMPDYQRSGRPEILKTLLTAQAQEGMSDSEMHRYDSPDMSEPDPSHYQVEAIVSVPDTYSDTDISDDENEQTRPESRSEEEVDSDVEVGDCSQLDINKIIGIEQDNEDVEEEVTYGAVEEEVSDNVEVENVVEEQVVEENIEVENVEVENMDDNMMYSDTKGSGDTNKHDDGDDEDIVAPLVPIVEMNDSLHDDNMDDDSDDDMSPENRLTIVENSFDQNVTITPSQKAFLTNYRDLIEQINTMKCKCCDRNFPRRKAVIQHLQKNGSKIPKHTCYTCVIPFTHIGALLSHMRYNCCNDTWKLIYREGGIPDSMVVEEPPSPDVQDYGNEESTKSQYRDVLNARSYSCKLCSSKFHLKQYVMKHVFDVHENSSPQVALTCFNCKHTFAESRLWKKHVRNGQCTVDICCDLCSEKFMTLQEFNEHAVTAHADHFQHQNQTNDNQQRNSDGRSTSCPLCKKSLSNYHNLVKHLKMVHNEEKPHICQFCFSKYKHVTELQHHINIEHSERMNGDDSEMDYSKEEVTGYNYSCTECSAVFDSVEGWTEHQINVHHHIAHECDQCDKKFWDEVELEEHRNMHLKGKPFKCMLCSNSYSSSKNLSEHINHMHQESISDKYDSQFYCDICIRSFKSRQAFSNHMRIHAKVPTTNRRPGDMKRDPQYRSPSHLPRPPPQLAMKTMKPTHQAAPYSCDICGKGFQHKKNIWKHKKMLHPDVVSKSKENMGSVKSKGASTEDEEYGNDDQNTHLSTPQFDSFSTAYEQPDNSGSEVSLPYQCDLCDKKFAVKSSIWKHKRVKHGVINPQQDPAKPEIKQDVASDINRTSCTICKINFTDKKAYYRHRKNAHKVKVCKICGITLSTSMELFEHLQTAHAKELLGYNESQGKPQKNYRTVDVNNSTEDEEVDDESVSHPTNHKNTRYSCETCGQGFNELMAIQNHVCFQRMAVSETYDCEICNKSYTSISALKSHRGWHLRSPDGRAAFSNSGLWMPQNKVTNKVSKHEVVEAARPKQPPVQHKEISPLHIKRKLPPDVQVTVLKKPKISDEVTVEAVTPRLEHPSAPRQVAVTEDRYCELCNKGFAKKAAYQRHMDEVHKPNAVFCPICNKSFTRKSTLLVHMRKHDTGDISEPPDPDDSDDESNLDGRLQNFRCDVCNMQYDSMNALNLHKMKNHRSGNDNDRQFNQPSNLRYQGQGNDGRVIEEGVIKEFKCSLCEEEWDTEQEVWNHHHFQCNVCRMSFSQHQYLVTHTQTLHSNKEHMFFSCSKCNRSFMNKQSLQRHIEAFH